MSDRKFEISHYVAHVKITAVKKSAKVDQYDKSPTERTTETVLEATVAKDDLESLQKAIKAHVDLA